MEKHSSTELVITSGASKSPKKIDGNIQKMADKSELIADVLLRIDLLTSCFIAFLLTRLVFLRLCDQMTVYERNELISRIFSDLFSHACFLKWYKDFLFDFSYELTPIQMFDEGPRRDIGGSGDWRLVIFILLIF